MNDSLTRLALFIVASGLLQYSEMICLLLLILFLPFTSEAREPSIREIQQEVIRYSGFDHRQVEGWDKKSRWSAALPRLQMGFERVIKDQVTLTTRDSVSISGGDVFVGPDENNFDRGFNQGTSFEVKAVWLLNELIFNRDTLSASNERRAWVRDRTKSLEEVTRAFYVRKRLIGELKTHKEPRLVRERKKIQLDEMTAMIDAHTGGWFSEELQK